MNTGIRYMMHILIFALVLENEDNLYGVFPYFV